MKVLSTLLEQWRCRKFLWHVTAITKALGTGTIRMDVDQKTDDLKGIAMGSLAEPESD